MQLTYPDAAEVSSDNVTRLLELLMNTWHERDPDVDLRQGSLRDLVLHPLSLLTAVQEQAILNAITALSLTGIAANPSLASTEATDRLLGNFGLVRRAGQAARGQLTIVISRLQSVVIPARTTFTVGSVEFTADATYAARTSEPTVTGPNDRLLVAVSGGYGFSISVTAKTVGEAGNITQGASATTTIAIPGLVRLHATADFSGGSSDETNSQLLARQQQGLAAKIWGGRGNLVAATASAFNLIRGSVIGAGQSEMRRDKRAAWPIGTGMRTDFWVRTSSACETILLAKTATLISKVGSVGTWQVSITRDEAPGFYEVVKILLPSADQATSGFAAASTTRGTDLSTDAWYPTMPTALDSAFSRYQTAVVQFVDTVTDATALVVSTATATYNVYVRTQPKIKEIQEFWAASDRRPPAGDLLVRAAVPCLVTVAATFSYTSSSSYSAATVKTAIATAVNGIDFTGSVPASLISQAIHAALPGTLAVTSIALTGRLIKPSGTVVNLSSSTAITISDDFDNMVSSKTVAFFLSTSDITLTATAV